MGWILETNKAMNRGMEAMNGRIVKRYRLYEKPLDGGPSERGVDSHGSMSDAAHDPIEPDEGEVRHLPVPSSVPEARPIERAACGRRAAGLPDVPPGARCGRRGRVPDGRGHLGVPCVCCAGTGAAR